MAGNDHYLTCAAFFLRDQSDKTGPGILNCWTEASLGGRSLMRKHCICGSPIIFDKGLARWLCSDSATDLEVSPWNQEPLLPPEISAHILERHKAQFSNPERESITLIDKSDHPHVFVKVPEDGFYPETRTLAGVGWRRWR